MRALPALVIALALAALPATAQQHEHPATGAAFIVPGTAGPLAVGRLATFAVVADADGDLRPDVHQDNHIRVRLNGALLWEASPAAGHDYDGVNTFSLVFPAAGAYEVAVLAPDGKVAARHTGAVEAARAGAGVKVDLQGPDEVPALQPAAFTVQAWSGGASVGTLDAIFEVREGSDLVFRTPLRGQEGPAKTTYAFPRPGSYTVRATAYASTPGAGFGPAFAERAVVVGPPEPTAAGLPVPGTPSPVGQNVVVDGTTNGGPYALFGTYDPYTVAGPGTQMHLAALTMDPATRRPVPDVAFTATLTGPLGPVFSSTSLLEADGLYEVVAKQPAPGAYKLVVEARKEGWSGRVELPYTVALNAAASGFGPVHVTAAAEPLVAGNAATVTLSAQDAAGMPYQHSELDVAVLDTQGNGLLWTKLHTHDDGRFPLTLAFPAAGSYTLRVAPSALDGLPANFAGPKGAAVDLAVEVAAGPGLPPALEEAGQATRAAAGAGPLAVLAVLACAFAVQAVAWRRKRPF